jgi:hypothetical protein
VPAVEAADRSSGAIVSDSGLDTAALASPPPSPESIGAALLGPLLLGFLGALACWPTAALARTLHGDAAAATRTGMLWTMVPAVALMTPELDQALALPVTASIAALAAALQPEAPGAAWVARAAAAGALAAVAEFFSYGAAVFVLIGALAVLAFAGRRAARRAALAAGVALAAGGRRAGSGEAGRPSAALLRPDRPLHPPPAVHGPPLVPGLGGVRSLDLFWFLGPPLVASWPAWRARAVTRRAGRRETDLDRFRPRPCSASSRS